MLPRLFVMALIGAWMTGCSSQLTTDFYIANETMIETYPINDQSGYLVTRLFLDDPYPYTRVLDLTVRHEEESPLDSGTLVRMFNDRGDPLVVMRVRAGTYTWDNMSYEVAFQEDFEPTKFEIKPNSFNYIGDIAFQIGETNSTQIAFKMGGADNAKGVWKILEQRFPESSQEYEFVNQLSIPRLAK